jgi:hypothetical protein
MPRFAPALRCASGSGPFRPPSGDRHEGRDGRGRSGGGSLPTTTDQDDTDVEPLHYSSPTRPRSQREHQPYGCHPFHDEPDPRLFPQGEAIAGAVADIFDAHVATLSDARLEPDIDDLLRSAVNLFHRATGRIERELDYSE